MSAGSQPCYGLRDCQGFELQGRRDEDRDRGGEQSFSEMEGIDSETTVSNYAQVRSCSLHYFENSTSCVHQCPLVPVPRQTGHEQLPCRWYEAILAAADDIATIMTAECGKPLAEAKGEVVQG